MEVSAFTGIPLEEVRRLDWNDLATYVDVLTPKGRHGV